MKKKTNRKVIRSIGVFFRVSEVEMKVLKQRASHFASDAEYIRHKTIYSKDSVYGE